MKSSTYCFHVKTKLLAVFQICISVPLTMEKSHFMFELYYKTTFLLQKYLTKKCYTTKPFCHSKILFFPAESAIHRWQSHRFSGLLWKYELNLRSSHWSCSVKKGNLKNFANFTGKNLRWSLFLMVFSCGICEIFKKTYFEEHLRTTASETCSAFTRTVFCW